MKVCVRQSDYYQSMYDLKIRQNHRSKKIMKCKVFALPIVVE